MIYSHKIEEFPIKGNKVASFFDKNEEEWKVIRVKDGFFIAYFGEPYFKETYFCVWINNEEVTIHNTGCFFITNVNTFFKIKSILENSYTDDIWEVIQDCLNERFSKGLGITTNEKKVFESLENNKNKIINVGLEINKNATDDEYERYNAVLMIISYQLFKNEFGIWAGRESGIEDSEIETENYWYVLHDNSESVKQEIERIIKNFNIQNFTNLKIGNPFNSNINIKSKCKKRKALKWCLFK